MTPAAAAPRGVVPQPAAALPACVRVEPGPLAGDLTVPGDKSLSHRALLLGALCEGTVAVRGLATSLDVAATASALRALGATVALQDGGGGLEGTVSGPLREPAQVLNCGNSGTTLRLLAGVVATIEGLSVLTGDASLRRRPVDRVLLPLARMGARLDAREGGRLPPLVVRGGALRAIAHDSAVASAQVKSALLLAGLRADGRTSVTSPLPSRDHSERLLRYLGVEVTSELLEGGRERVEVLPGPLAARPIDVPGDPSSAAVWLAAAALAPAAGASAQVRVRGMCCNPTRLGAVEVLRALGAEVSVMAAEERCGEPVGDIEVRAAPLGGPVLVSGRTVVDAIDELPLLALVGATSRGGIEVRGAAELRVKESDRIAATAALFAALGLRLEERPDGFRVPGGQRPGPGRVDARGDHRIAMAAAVAATVATGPVEIAGFEAVGTSYPAFLDDLRQLGGRVEAVGATAAGG